MRCTDGTFRPGPRRIKQAMGTTYGRVRQWRRKAMQTRTRILLMALVVGPLAAFRSGMQDKSTL